MAWDADKSKGDTVKSADWDAMVTDQKDHSSRHGQGGSDKVLIIGDSNTYVEVDPTNEKIVLFVGGTKVKEWS